MYKLRKKFELQIITVFVISKSSLSLLPFLYQNRIIPTVFFHGGDCWCESVKLIYIVRFPWIFKFNLHPVLQNSLLP